MADEINGECAYTPDGQLIANNPENTALARQVLASGDNVGCDSSNQLVAEQSFAAQGHVVGPAELGPSRQEFLRAAGILQDPQYPTAQVNGDMPDPGAGARDAAQTAAGNLRRNSVRPPR